MNDITFFSTIVLPTVDEFSRNPGDIRRGVLACLVLQAMNEHFFRRKKEAGEDPSNGRGLGHFKTDLRTKDLAFGQIMDIANGTKHAKKKFYDLRTQVPSQFGIMRFGFPFSPAEYVFIDGDYARTLCQLTEHVTDVWKAKLGICGTGSEP